MHLILWFAIILWVLAWLVVVYRVFEVVNTPGSDTGSFMVGGRLAGLQSLYANFDIVSRAIGDGAYLLTGVVFFLLAVLVFAQDITRNAIDAGATFTIFGACIAYYFLMSFFRGADVRKWMIVATLIEVLFAVALVYGARLLGILLDRLSGGRWMVQLLPVVGFAAFCIVFLSAALHQWNEVRANVWSKHFTLNLLNDWFDENVPQGGRVVSEAIKMPFNYPYAPTIVHAYVTNNIFNGTTLNYQSRGYEYLIWNNIISNPDGAIHNLDVAQTETWLRDAIEVLRLTGENVTGPDIVVFQLQPIQQHVLYAWFTPAISFRGYDLNKESFNAGDTLELMLYWMSAERTTANYIVFVHLLFGDGKTLLAGQDGPPDYGNTPTWKWEGDMQFIRDQRILTIPADAPPGKYILRMGMYDADTKLRAQITSPQGQPFGDTLTLQEIEIEK